MKKKCRQYSVEYLNYGFIESPTNNILPMHLICQKVLSNEAMKLTRLKGHLTNVHGDKKNMNLSYFQALKENFLKQPALAKLFRTALKQDDNGLHASYNILLLITKMGKPRTIGEKLILPAISEVIRTMLHDPASDIIKKIYLSKCKGKLMK